MVAGAFGALLQSALSLVEEEQRVGLDIATIQHQGMVAKHAEEKMWTIQSTVA